MPSKWIDSVLGSRTLEIVPMVLTISAQAPWRTRTYRFFRTFKDAFQPVYFDSVDACVKPNDIIVTWIFCCDGETMGWVFEHKGISIDICAKRRVINQSGSTKEDSLTEKKSTQLRFGHW